MFKPVFASILAVGATAVLAVGALAAGGTGTQHFNLTTPQQCFPKGDMLICVSSRGEATSVFTPSGGFSNDINMTSAFSATNLGVPVATGTSSTHEHDLVTSNFAVLQEMGLHSVSTVISNGQTCTFSQDFHVTQLDLYTGTGHIQYDNVSLVCV